jgi:hypothetical protein
MRIATVLFSSVACSAALASQPGQPLDCSDWIVSAPGIACSAVIPPDCSTQSACIRGVPITADNAGRLLYVRREATPIGTCGGNELYRSRIVARDPADAAETLIAVVSDRCTISGDSDSITSNESAEPPDLPITHQPVLFDPINGRLLVPMRSYCRNGGGGCASYVSGGGGVWLAAFSGFATTFEILQTYAPQPPSVGIRVPYMPDGLPAADHFDTYYGPLTHPINFSAAQPLACGYPSAPPHVGDYVTVNDRLPDPEPGTGRYYVTAATYQGQSRYGRKTSHGRLSGRDSGLLPACVLP